MKNRRFYADLVNLLGFLPRNLAYYRLAFLPKSALQKQPSGIELNNERLEYLGDAVLDAIVADYLFRKFPDGDEGFMTMMRARIVKRKSLDSLAKKMGIPHMISASTIGEQKSKHLYGNALEALIGAIYLDRGYGTAKKFTMRRILKKHVNLSLVVKKDPDHKSRIIEWAQKNHLEVEFKSKEEKFSTGHFPSFISTILLEGEERGTGRGSSKKDAEQRAAREALSTLQSH